MSFKMILKGILKITVQVIGKGNDKKTHEVGKETIWKLMWKFE